MPTTNDEATKIVEICKRHGIDGVTLYSLARELDKEVGQVSKNDSVKVTMRMLCDAVTGLATLNPGERRQENKPRPELFSIPMTVDQMPGKLAPCCHAEESGAVDRTGMILQLILALVVTFHTVVWLGLATSFCVLPFLAPLYVALPCMAFILVQATTTEACPVTRFENWLREKLGMPTIAKFGPHYFFHWLLGQKCGQ